MRARGNIEMKDMEEEGHRFYFSKKMKIILFSLLIVLNLILRIPFYPHEYGADSFEIHVLANSISQFGYARWWLNSLSIFGLYPYSECSAVPFILSGISQCTGIDMEKVILLFCIFLGLLTVFAAYILAGAIWNNDLFKFLVAFGLSTCPAILNYLTWTITTRAPFIALLPLFAYSLLRSHNYRLRFSAFTVILFILLFLTHQLAYFLIPVSIAYILAIIFYKLKCLVPSRVKIPGDKIIAPIVLITGFIIMFMIPFQTGHFIEESSRYSAAPNIFFANLPRYVGVLGIFSVGGVAYLLFKHDKRFEEWCLLLFLMFLMPFLYVETYMKWFIPCFIFPFVGMGLINAFRTNEQKRKYALILVVILLLLSISFSGFYQHWRTKGGLHLFANYMKDSTYTTGLWIKENIDNGSLISNDGVSVRIFAVSGVPLFTGCSDAIDYVYGYVNLSELKLKPRKITEDAFWMDGPYEMISWESEIHRREILLSSYERYKNSKYSKFNFTHVIEDKRISHGYFAYHGINPSPFLDYVYNTKDSIYDNGKVCIWSM